MPDRRAIFAIPGDIDQPTGGYAYDRRMLAELGGLGWQMTHVALSDRFPTPDAATLSATYRLLAALPEQVPIVIDGLALGVLPDIGRHLSARHKLVALVHHPLALESGVPADRAAALRSSERAALAAARHVIVNSRLTAATLVAEFGVPAASITIAEPGTDPVPLSRGSGAAAPHLLSVGTLVPRKGHDVLIAALATLRDLSWTLTIVGDDTRDLDTTRMVRNAIAAAGLESRIGLTGALPARELEKHYATSDIFVLASRYEGYGMVYAEALAHGLPVIGTRAGAVPDVVPDATGLLVPPDDVPALAAALRTMLADPTTRARYATAARAAAASLPSWSDSARRFAHALELALT